MVSLSGKRSFRKKIDENGVLLIGSFDLGRGDTAKHLRSLRDNIRSITVLEPCVSISDVDLLGLDVDMPSATDFHATNLYAGALCTDAAQITVSNTNAEKLVVPKAQTILIEDKSIVRFVSAENVEHLFINESSVHELNVGTNLKSFAANGCEALAAQPGDYNIHGTIVFSPMLTIRGVKNAIALYDRRTQEFVISSFRGAGEIFRKHCKGRKTDRGALDVFINQMKTVEPVQTIQDRLGNNA